MEEIQTKEYHFEAEDVDPVENPVLAKYLEDYRVDFVRLGPKKYFLHKPFMRFAADLYNLPIRSDDVFVVSFPKTGTTIAQELAWLINNNLDYEKAQSIVLNERSPFFELFALDPTETLEITSDQMDVFSKVLKPMTIDEIKEMPSPRFFKSHLPLSLLPPSLLDKAKVIYTARDPRDVAVSYHHHQMFMKLTSPDKKLKAFWEHFLADSIPWTPFFDHVLEAWEKRNHPNMLFMFYEEMTKDMPTTIRRVANFCGKTITDEQVNGLADHLSIDKFKKNKSVNMQHMQELGIFSSEESFIRKGKSGSWREVFDEEMTAQAEEWIEKNLRNTDLRFPQ